MKEKLKTALSYVLLFGLISVVYVAIWALVQAWVNFGIWLLEKAFSPFFKNKTSTE